MKKATKLWLIIAASLILIGCIIFTGVMSMLKWDFSKLSTNKFETNNYEITENFKNISIKTQTADILILPSESQKASVVCYEQENTKHSVEAKGDTLAIRMVDTRKWYNYIGFNLSNQKITVYIPAGEYGDLSIESSTGEIKIENNLEFENIKISQSTGDISAQSISACSINLSLSTGNISLSKIDCEGEIKLDLTTGKTELSEIKCQKLSSIGSTGKMVMNSVVAEDTLSLERSTGDITLEKCDASNIFIKTSTGDVSGSLLNEKVFITETDTGKINVPKTISGGKCEIKTDTGDIEIGIN